MPAAVKPAERVSLTYDERNGNYNSNKTPFLKIKDGDFHGAVCWQVRGEVDALRAVGRGCARGRDASSPATSARTGKAWTLRPGAPGSAGLSESCHMREAKGGRRSTLPPRFLRRGAARAAASAGNGCAPPAHPRSLLCSALLVLPPARFSAFGGSSGLIFAAERVAPAKSQAGFGLGHP